MAQSMPFVDSSSDEEVTISNVNPIIFSWNVFTADTTEDWEIISRSCNWDMDFYDLVVMGHDPLALGRCRLVLVTSKKVTATAALAGFNDDMPDDFGDWRVSSPQAHPKPPTIASLVKELKAWSSACRFKKFGNVESIMTKLEWHDYYTQLDELDCKGVPPFVRKQYMHDTFKL